MGLQRQRFKSLTEVEHMIINHTLVRCSTAKQLEDMCGGLSHSRFICDIRWHTAS